MPIIEVGVHSLLELAFKTGGLNAGFAAPTRLQAGVAAHAALGSRRPAGYQREVAIAHTFAAGEYCLIVRGRIDGVLEDDDGILVEELKTTYLPVEALRPDTYPAHTAQLQLYHHFMCARRPGERVRAALTYLNPATGAERTFTLPWTPAESEAFFTALALELLRIEEDCRRWLAVRDAGLRALTFPFPDPRDGQTELMAAVELAIMRRQDLLAEAATGIGKTMGALFPALRRLGDAGYARIFYLTAKTSGAESVRQSLEILRARGLRLRTLYLQAKERVCPLAGPEKPECDADECPYAVDFYPRAARALPGLLHHESWTPELIADAAEREQLCPFELALELSRYADCIVGDYNYVFDPGVYLRRFFWPGQPPDNLLIIDEAHNLVPRAREMYSATVEEAALRELAALYPDPALTACLDPLLARFARWREDLAFEGAKALPLPELPKEFPGELDAVIAVLGERLAALPRGPLRTTIKDHFFELLHADRIAAELTGDDVCFVAAAGKATARLRLFCPHPARHLRRRLERGTAAIFLSGTLAPVDYFRALLGVREGAGSVHIPSPFPPEHRLYLHVPDVSTRYSAREATRPSVARVILDTVRAHRGNYLAFFPSYAYLGTVWAELTLERPEDIDLYAQKPGMSRDAQAAFLHQVCTPAERAHLGLAVMGGLFGEAVDLPGEQLVGVIVVGPGLPGLSPESELIRAYYDEREQDGFYHAYIVPGLIRVVQAAGRVFRTPHDRGVVILMDDRFLDDPYRALLPLDWGADDPEFSTRNYRERLAEFWG